MTEASIIIVSYNGKDMLLQTVRSVVEHVAPTTPVKIIVVENGSDGGAHAVRAAYPFVHVVDNPKNTGFAGGNNLGFAQAEGEFVLLLNPDTVCSDRTLRPMLDFMAAHPRCGVCGPRVLNKDDAQISNPSFKDTLTGTFVGLLGRLKLARRTEPRPDVQQQCDFAHGSCLLARTAVYRELNGLDERLFLYCEELEFCRRALAIGYETWYVPDAVVWHLEPPKRAGTSWAQPLQILSALEVYGRFHSSFWMLGYRVLNLLHVPLDLASMSARVLRGRQHVNAPTLSTYLNRAISLLFPVSLAKRLLPRPNRTG